MLAHERARAPRSALAQHAADPDGDGKSEATAIASVTWAWDPPRTRKSTTRPNCILNQYTCLRRAHTVQANGVGRPPVKVNPKAQEYPRACLNDRQIGSLIEFLVD